MSDQDGFSAEDTCCACYGCPDCEHDCGLPPEEAAARRAYYLKITDQLLSEMLESGEIKACAECGTPFATAKIAGDRCYEHGGMLLSE